MSNFIESKTYHLKGMVLLRMLAELTVLGILIALPIVLWLVGIFAKLSFISQALLVVAAAVAAMVAPAYGFITTNVSIDVYGFYARSLFRKQFILWRDVEGLRLRSAFGWRRYVLVGATNEEISFPVWVHEIEDLVDKIRSQIPEGGRMVAVSGVRVYAQDRTATLFQISKLLIGLGFVVVFWIFYASLQARKHADPSDAWIILGATVIFTCAMLYRSYVIVMMPRVVSTDETGLIVQTWFKRAQLSWSELKAITLPLFFLPEGIVIKTEKGKYLIGNQLDAFDELQDELKDKLAVKEAPHH